MDSRLYVFSHLNDRTGMLTVVQGGFRQSYIYDVRQPRTSNIV